MEFTPLYCVFYGGCANFNSTELPLSAIFERAILPLSAILAFAYSNFIMVSFAISSSMSR